MSAKTTLEHSDEFPYDAGAKFWNGSGSNPPKAKDWAHRAARAVITELKGRGGFDDLFENFEHSLRKEIVKSITNIITLAEKSK